MPEKYNLKEILEEIKEDEKMAGTPKGKVSQEMIQKMMLDKLKKRKSLK